MRLKNRNAIITGANQGLGLAIAEEFVKEGASLVICARDDIKLENARERLMCMAGPSQKIISLKADVSVESDVNSFIARSIDDLNSIDIFVNNAGVYGPKGQIEDVDSTEWTRAIEINLFGIFYSCKYIIPHMKEKRYGIIIHFSGGGSRPS